MLLYESDSLRQPQQSTYVDACEIFALATLRLKHTSCDLLVREDASSWQQQLGPLLPLRFACVSDFSFFKKRTVCVTRSDRNPKALQSSKQVSSS